MTVQEQLDDLVAAMTEISNAVMVLSETKTDKPESKGSPSLLGTKEAIKDAMATLERIRK